MGSGTQVIAAGKLGRVCYAMEREPQYVDVALPRGRRKAMSLLDESLALSSELGMRPLMERVQSRREILGA